jgi:ABC-type lipoprotein release transport system permease subunit
MRNAIYGIGVYDAPTMFFVVLVLSILTLLAATIPALRVAAIDPVKVLREE